MPGCARRVRAAYSRTLCLPCLKAGIFCFNTTATDLVMSSFLFLTFCVYVFRCLGLHFSVSILSKLSFGGFYLRRTNLHRGLTLAQQGWSGASVVSLPYPALKTAHRVAQGRVWFFLPRTSLPLPLKGEGLGFIQFGVVQFSLGSCPWQLPLTNGSHGSNGAGLGLWWCRSPTWRPKPHTGPHRAEFGFHHFFLVRFGFGGADKSFSSL